MLVSDTPGKKRIWIQIVISERDRMWNYSSINLYFCSIHIQIFWHCVLAQIKQHQKNRLKVQYNFPLLWSCFWKLCLAIILLVIYLSIITCLFTPHVNRLVSLSKNNFLIFLVTGWPKHWRFNVWIRWYNSVFGWQIWFVSYVPFSFSFLCFIVFLIAFQSLKLGVQFFKYDEN